MDRDLRIMGPTASPDPTLTEYYQTQRTRSVDQKEISPIPSDHHAFPVADRHEFYIVDEKNESIATATVFFRHRVYWITNIWTNPTYRKRGLASRIIRAVIDRYGNHTIYLNVDAYGDRPRSNEELISYYQRFGFIPSLDPGVMRRDPTSENDDEE
jgi:ribosomal protein S18 acetylase RimI-like enzyme